MQWHWGNIGSAAAGLATLIVALRLLWSAPDWYRTWKERQNAERDLAREQTKASELERRRGLYGWSDQVETYGVALVAGADELSQAATELAGGQPSDYVVLRVSESTYGNANRANSLRQLIQYQGFISRPPTPGEREALEKGLGEFGIMSAAVARRECQEAVPDASAQQS